ncbi:Putative tartrate transporter [Paraburkholderia ultramafica]|uniref:Tartrate transporter n=1 Tax=Paraburkholderia ultramafica TaxID=1544867 RepID=A0A6S7BRI1_9BURK|nr:MFS transporter [Paraburkholderia ultramafica]CAB3797003.1 Putative tartrate transporter [Paraburkholderia ultramafica]
METSAYLPAAAEAADVARNKLYRKLTLRLAPFIFVAYAINQLNRFNISFAKLQFMKDLALSDFSFALGAGLFFIGYVIFEVPSSLYLQKVGARATFIRIMVLWGLLSGLTAFVHTPTQFYLVRFLLGAAEAGFMPGVILYLTYWFPANRRARITSLFYLAATTSGVIGGPISGLILKYSQAWGLMSSWQWLFVVEGVPTVLLGVFAYYYLQDYPKDAKWLSREEKDILTQDLKEDHASANHNAVGLRDVIKLPRIYAFGLAYFAVVAANNTLAVWAPTLIKDTGIRDVFDIGILSAIPYVVGAIGMLIIAGHSDKMRERRWHFALPFALTAIGFALIGLFYANIYGTIILLSLASIGIFTAFAIFWAMPTQYLSTSAKAAGIGYISTIGMFGGFFSPIILGYAKTVAGTFVGGFVAMAVISVIGVLLIFVAAPKTST